MYVGEPHVSFSELLKITEVHSLGLTGESEDAEIGGLLDNFELANEFLLHISGVEVPQGK